MADLMAYAFVLLFVFLICGIGWSAGSSLGKHLSRTMHWIQQVCLGAALLVVTIAAVGVLLAVMPYAVRQPLALAALTTLSLLSVRSYVKGALAAFFAASSLERIYAMGAIVLMLIATTLALLPVKLPTVLVDGPYVAKHDLLGVRVQYSTGNLPTDNAIPHVVSEYLLRGISFREERPIMPGQEVTNRPILAGLVVSVFRAASFMPPEHKEPLPRFSYVGQQWPDFSALMHDELGYIVSQAVGIVLNGLLLLGIGAIAVGRNGKPEIAVGVVLLFLTSPYFLFQTYFTWPKSLAGFFVLLAWLAATRWKSWGWAGAILGLAYLSHPYAIAYFLAYAICHIGYELLSQRKELGRLRWKAGLYAAGSVLIPFLLVIGPWLLWKSWTGIPSDLISQNFKVPGLTVFDYAWMRLFNTLSTILPVYLLRPSFDLIGVVLGSAVSLSGALGLIIALAGALVWRGQFDRVNWVLWGLPAALLIAVFSNAAVPMLHGLQPLAAFLLWCCVCALARSVSAPVFISIVGLQTIINVTLMVAYYHALL